MTFLQMRCFLSLASTKKLTETANIYNLRASTLSKYLDHMEDSFSVRLFRKTQSGLEITKEGEIIYPSMQYIVKKYDDLLACLNGLKKTDRRTATVAMAFHQPQILMNLIEFSKIYPDNNLSISEAPSSKIRTMLDSSSIDIAMTYEELLGKKYPLTLPIRRDRLVAVVSRRHPLAARKSISLAELAGDAFFLFRGDALMYRYQVHTCIGAGFTPQEAPHDLRVNTAIEYTAENRGVSLLVESAVNSVNHPGVVALPLDENPTLTMSIVFPGEYLGDAGRKLIAFMKSQYRQPE